MRAVTVYASGAFLIVACERSAPPVSPPEHAAEPAALPAQPSPSSDASAATTLAPDAGVSGVSRDAAPAEVDATAAVADVVETDSDAAVAAQPKCPIFPPRRLYDWRSVPELVGRTRAYVIACFGQPSDPNQQSWTYRRPEGCAYEKTELVVELSGDKVRRARVRGFVTGQHCM